MGGRCSIWRGTRSNNTVDHADIFDETDEIIEFQADFGAKHFFEYQPVTKIDTQQSVSAANFKFNTESD